MNHSVGEFQVALLLFPTTPPWEGEKPAICRGCSTERPGRAPKQAETTTPPQWSTAGAAVGVSLKKGSWQR